MLTNAWELKETGKEILVILPFLGLQSNVITKQLKACINKFYGCIDLRVIFQSNHHASAIADHVTSTGHNFKWDHFDILAKGRSPCEQSLS